MNTDAWLAELERTVRARVDGAEVPRALTVLYDPGCRLCLRCRAWMLGQPAYVELQFLPATSPEARARFGDLPWLGDELVVVGDHGEVWVGPAAFLTCLWALVDWRDWSYRLAGPTLSVLAERFFLFLSSNRRSLGTLVRAPRCRDGRCDLDHGRRP
jgi:predicted DCC family thiol-disulfide oxidoreductase YuxK